MNIMTYFYGYDIKYIYIYQQLCMQYVYAHSLLYTIINIIILLNVYKVVRGTQEILSDTVWKYTQLIIIIRRACCTQRTYYVNTLEANWYLFIKPAVNKEGTCILSVIIYNIPIYPSNNIRRLTRPTRRGYIPTN